MSSSAPWPMPSCCASRLSRRSSSITARRSRPSSRNSMRLSRCPISPTWRGSNMRGDAPITPPMSSRCRAPPSPRCQRGVSASARVTLHPSVGIVASRFPVLSIWEVNQDRAVRAVPNWGAEAAVVARPFLEVETRRLLPGTDVFLLALQAGSTIAEAVERAAAADLRVQCFGWSRHADRRASRRRPSRS